MSRASLVGHNATAIARRAETRHTACNARAMLTAMRTMSKPSRTSLRTGIALAFATVAAACPLKPATAYDQSCTVDTDCVPLKQDCGCTTGAIARSEAGHAEFDFVVNRLPVAFMVDCGVLPACTAVAIACTDGTCAALPAVPPAR